MGQRIVQFAGDVQALLVGAAAREFLAGALGFLGAAFGLAQRLPRCACRDQPRDLQRTPRLRERRAGVVQGGERGQR